MRQFDYIWLRQLIDEKGFRGLVACGCQPAEPFSLLVISFGKAIVT